MKIKELDQASVSKDQDVFIMEHEDSTATTQTMTKSVLFSETNERLSNLEDITTTHKILGNNGEVWITSARKDTLTFYRVS